MSHIMSATVIFTAKSSNQGDIEDAFVNALLQLSVVDRIEDIEIAKIHSWESAHADLLDALRESVKRWRKFKASNPSDAIDSGNTGGV